MLGVDAARSVVGAQTPWRLQEVIQSVVNNPQWYLKCQVLLI